jgi:hypothetical protein
MVEGGESVDKIMRFRERMAIVTHRRPFRTGTGYLSDGDKIALFKDGIVPLVVWPKGQMR